MPTREDFTTTIRLLLTGDLAALLEAIGRAGTGLYRRLASRRVQGIYEVLDHDTTVELRDFEGKVATVQRRETVRFLQNHVVAFTDYAWGDGETLAEYSCSPGWPVDNYYDGSKHTILISLREAKSRGDVLRFRINRKVLGGFTKHDEWWETETYHRTSHLRIAIIFPKQRHCQRAVVTQRSTNQTTALGPQHFRFLGDGRQKLTWQIAKPRLHDRYTLKWLW